MKKLIDNIKQWGIENPKKVFFYGVILIVLSMIGAVIQYIYFPPKPMTYSIIPKLNEQSNKTIEKIKQNEQQKSEIIEEAKKLKKKRDEQTLTKEDSLRAEYLMYKLKELENERTP